MHQSVELIPIEMRTAAQYKKNHILSRPKFSAEWPTTATLLRGIWPTSTLFPKNVTAQNGQKAQIEDSSYHRVLSIWASLCWIPNFFVQIKFSIWKS